MINTENMTEMMKKFKYYLKSLDIESVDYYFEKDGNDEVILFACNNSSMYITVKFVLIERLYKNYYRNINGAHVNLMIKLLYNDILNINEFVNSLMKIEKYELLLRVLKELDPYQNKYKLEIKVLENKIKII